jgi:hypothetical protein
VAPNDSGGRANCGCCRWRVDGGSSFARLVVLRHYCRDLASRGAGARPPGEKGRGILFRVRKRLALWSERRVPVLEVVPETMINAADRVSRRASHGQGEQRRGGGSSGGVVDE